jgi:Outer membrane protein beta-barrel domain
MKVLLIFIFFSFVTIATAQEPSRIPEKYYPKPRITSTEILIGPSLIGVAGKEKSPTRFGQSIYTNPLESKLGYCFGLGISHQLTSRFEISARLLYEQKGYVMSLDTLSFDSNFTLISRTRAWSENINNNYLTLSILPQLVLGNRVHFNIAAGGYVGSLISSRTEYKGQTNYTYVSDPNYNKYDFGLCFNTGISYPIKANLELTIQLTANYGLYHISDRFISFNYPKWHNSSYAILAGIRFFIKKYKLKI